ncbi:hypothetical protein AB0K05_22655 [Nonomuraea sp. NPDC049486]|uniref:DUF1648 domain-containing protein n=1 Tax=Nonomuraea sp. NPDC049486 TaxID=3155773 RepID=UPI0034204DEC
MTPFIVTALVSVLVSVALITCLMLALPALARPALPFGVRVPADRAGDPAVVGQRRRFARLVIVVGVVAAVMAVPVLLVTGYAAGVTVTVSAVIVADLLLYYLAHRRVSAAKRAGAWSAGRRQGVTVDTTFRTDPVRVPWKHGLPALGVLLITGGIGWSRLGGLPATLPLYLGFAIDPGERVATTPLRVFEPLLYQVAVLVVVVALVVVVLRARPDLDAARPRGSARRYRLYLRGVASMSLLAAACLNLSLLVGALQLWDVVTPGIGWQVAAYVPLVALLAGWVGWEIKAGQAGHRLPALPGEEDEDSGIEQRDDDRHWFLAGAVYANRRDPALLVHARLGTGSWTLNLGHPIAWLLLGVLAVALLVLGALSLSGVVDLPRRHSLW